MNIEINTTNAQDMLMEDIFSQFEQASQELEKESNQESFELSLEDIQEIEADSKLFNHFVEIGLIELS